MCSKNWPSMTLNAPPITNTGRPLGPIAVLFMVLTEELTLAAMDDHREPFHRSTLLMVKLPGGVHSVVMNSDEPAPPLSSSVAMPLTKPLADGAGINIHCWPFQRAR